MIAYTRLAENFGMNTPLVAFSSDWLSCIAGASR